MVDETLTLLVPSNAVLYNHPMLIYDLDLPALTNLLKEWKEPSYRAKQIWQGLYQHFYNSPEQFTTLSKPLREKLKELDFAGFSPTLIQDSSDGQTRKTLFKLHDGHLIEAVLMRYDPDSSSARGRRTLCISTQAGCAMGCVFCATGQLGFKRHLSSGEIVAQVMYYARLLKEEDLTVTNIVLMGMGEPFHNYDNTMAAIDRLNDAKATTLEQDASRSQPLGWFQPSGDLPTKRDKSTSLFLCMPLTINHV
ncbi:MAG: radical SAM protein [Anaerolineales bacterium]